MVFSRAKTILLLAILAIAACSKKDETPFVARVGDLKITPDEFKRRFELNPRMLQFKDVNQAKTRFLGSLIAEKLLAAEAQEQDFPSSSRTQTFLDQINREAVIEEFFNDKAASKIHVDEKELREAYARQRKDLLVQHVSFKSLREARAFRQRVLAGGDFAEARSGVFGEPGHHETGGDTLTLKWGATDSFIEDALYQLKPGEISEPIPALDEFYVARVLSATAEGLGTDYDFLQTREKIERILKKRKTTAVFKKYFQEMMAGKKTSVPPLRLKFVSENLERAFAIGEKSDEYVRAANPSPIDEIELRRAQQGLHANLDEVLVTFDGGTTWTIKEFLQRLSVGRYHLDFSAVKNFRLSLRRAIITMIEQEYVYKEAVRSRVQKSSFVQEQVRVWRENAMAQEFLQKLLLPDLANQDLQESLAITNAHAAILDSTLSALLMAYDVEIDLKELNAAQVVNAGLLAFKTHFPGRLVVPNALPLENLAGWQEKIRQKLKQVAGETTTHE